MQLRILKTDTIRLLTMYIRLTGRCSSTEKKEGEQFNELVKNKDVSLCIFSVAGGDYLMEMLEMWILKVLRIILNGFRDFQITQH